MKRYAVFYFPDYYPSGGWSDFIGSFDTYQEAFAEAAKLDKNSWDNTQVIDLQTGQEILGYTTEETVGSHGVLHNLEFPPEYRT